MGSSSTVRPWRPASWRPDGRARHSSWHLVRCPTRRTLFIHPSQCTVPMLHQPGLDHVAQHLMHEQRLPSVWRCTSSASGCGIRCRLVSARRPQDVVGLQATQVYARHVASAVQLAQRGGERMCAFHLHIAVGCHDQQSRAVHLAREIEQQVEPRFASCRSSSTTSSGCRTAAARKRSVAAWRSLQRSSSGSPGAWGVRVSLSRRKGAIRASSARPARTQHRFQRVDRLKRCTADGSSTARRTTTIRSCRSNGLATKPTKAAR
jgi:hypothetical protein